MPGTGTEPFVPVLVRTFAMVLAGYVLVVLVAAFFCLLVIFATDAISGPLTGRRNFFPDFLFAYVIGLELTGMTAWPGYLATLAVSRWRGHGSTAYFAICGVATGILAVLLFAMLAPGTGFAREYLMETPAVYIGGMAGGFAYALFARRFRVFSRETG